MKLIAPNGHPLDFRLARPVHHLVGKPRVNEKQKAKRPARGLPNDDSRATFTAISWGRWFPIWDGVAHLLKLLRCESFVASCRPRLPIWAKVAIINRLVGRSA